MRLVPRCFVKCQPGRDGKIGKEGDKREKGNVIFGVRKSITGSQVVCVVSDNASTGEMWYVLPPNLIPHSSLLPRYLSKPHLSFHFVDLTLPNLHSKLPSVPISQDQRDKPWTDRPTYSFWAFFI